MKLSSVYGLLVGYFLISCNLQEDTPVEEPAPQIIGIEYYDEANVRLLKDEFAFNPDETRFSTLAFSTVGLDTTIGINFEQINDTTIFSYHWDAAFTEELMLINSDNKLIKVIGSAGTDENKSFKHYQVFNYNDERLQSILFYDVSSLYDMVVADSLTYFYDKAGENIVKVETWTKDTVGAFTLAGTEHYTYDNDTNPLYMMFYFSKAWADSRYYAPYFSKNNVTGWRTEGGPYPQESTYEPTYDQDSLTTGYKGKTTLIQDSITTKFTVKYLYEKGGGNKE